MNENTDRPAFDTCATALFAIANKHINMISPYFRILNSATKVLHFFELCKFYLHIPDFFCTFAPSKVFDKHKQLK